MIDLIESETHREAIKLIEKRIVLPLDYKEFNPQSKSNQIIIQQNNIIITLLFQLNNKIDKNIKEKVESKNIERPKNGRDGTRLIPPRQVSLKINHYNIVRK